MDLVSEERGVKLLKDCEIDLALGYVGVCVKDPSFFKKRVFYHVWLNRLPTPHVAPAFLSSRNNSTNATLTLASRVLCSCGTNVAISVLSSSTIV